MNLIIVESPHKAKTIEKYLDHKYTVLASAGHIRDLPKKKLGIDIEHDFKPEYVINADKKSIIKDLQTQVNKAEKVYLATDPDREGEAISWHLKDVLKIKDDDVRIEFNEISKKAVVNALNNPRKINLKLVDAQQARRVLDRLVGYKLSPILSDKIKKNLSAGRVQSVALKMIVDKEEEIRNFKVEEYWNIYANLSKSVDLNTVFKATLNDVNGKKVKVLNKESADDIINILKSADYKVKNVKFSTVKSFAPPPFTTSTLQQDATNKFGYSASQVMQIVQQLYEGVTLKSGEHKALVTYIRTDSVRVSKDAQISAKEFIVKLYGNDFVPASFNEYKSKDSAQDAHEAIRPIDLEITPQSLNDEIQASHYKLYKLIYDRFVASQMTPAEYDTLDVDINAHSNNNNDYGFKIKGKSLKFEGYLKAYRNIEENDVNALLPQFDKGDALILKDVKGEQKFTTPPSRFTDSSLIKAMEENGIGRPSTYATILSVLSKREYVIKEKKILKPTNLGETVCNMLVKYFPQIMNVKFTANMENNLDKIEEGIEWQSVIREFYPEFNKSVIDAKNDRTNMKVKDEVSEVKCEKCGAFMVIKDGKYGKFLACPNFPDCKNIKPYGEIVGKCPKCMSDIYKKKTKTGKLYFSCSKCDFKSWDKPAPFLCPLCGNCVKEIVKNDEKIYQCTNHSCTYNEKVKENEN